MGTGAGAHATAVRYRRRVECVRVPPTHKHSYLLARAYYRAKAAGRPVVVAAKRKGVSTTSLLRHAKLWPEVLTEMLASPSLKKWEHDNLVRIKEQRL